MLRRKGGQTSSRFTRVSDGSFRRTLQALRDAASVLAFLSKSLKKAFSIAAKGESAYMPATESKQVPGLVMAKLDFPLLVVSSCLRRLYGGPACIWRVASNGRFFFVRLQRANGSRVDLLVDHCMRNSLHAQFVQTLKHETVNYHNKRSPLSPTWSAACDMPWGVGRKSFIPRRSVLGRQITISRAARAQWWFGDLQSGLAWGMKL